MYEKDCKMKRLHEIHLNLFISNYISSENAKDRNILLWQDSRYWFQQVQFPPQKLQIEVKKVYLQKDLRNSLQALNLNVT